MMRRLKKIYESFWTTLCCRKWLFIRFVIDYYRHHLVDQHAETDMENAYGSTEGLLVGAIDAALGCRKYCGNC